MDGFLAVNKPDGLTSHDVVSRVRRAAGTKRVGHAGTLDPDATGVLLVAVNRATRLLPFLHLEPKVYIATLKLGIETTTQDASGEVVSELPADHLNQGDLETVLSHFVGELDQIPPMYSAVQIGGQRLYKLARQGIEVERQPRRITVHALRLLHFEQTVAQLEVICSGGTYVRTLCHDIGRALGVGGHMAVLERTAVGPFRLERAIPLNELTDRERVERAMVGMVEALWPEGAPTVPVAEDAVGRVLNGNPVETDLGDTGDRPVPMVCGDQILAFAEVSGGTAQPIIVLSPPAMSR